MKKNYKIVLYILLGAVALYGFIWLVTRQPQMPAEYKAAIDSLTKANAVLAEKQKQLDSTINVYENEVKQIDYQIDHIKEKTTVVKEYHHEVIQQVDHYNPTQVDSFFKTRYNY